MGTNSWRMKVKLLKKLENCIENYDLYEIYQKLVPVIME